MDIKTFKRKLAIHGADFSRWDGVDEADAKSFMAGSEEARSLYEEAKNLDMALDAFDVAAIDAGDMLRKTQDRIERGVIVSFPAGTQNSEIKTAAGALIACAAAIILVHSMGLQLDRINSAVPAESASVPVAMAAADDADARKVDAFVDEIYVALDEEGVADTLFAYLDGPQKNADEQKIDVFLDDVMEEDAPIWDMFYESNG